MSWVMRHRRGVAAVSVDQPHHVRCAERPRDRCLRISQYSKELGILRGHRAHWRYTPRGIFNGLVAGISSSTLVNETMTQEQIQQNLYAYAQNMQTSAPPTIPQSFIPEAQRIVDSTISSGMHLTFVSLTLIMLLGFVIALFLPRSAK